MQADRFQPADETAIAEMDESSIRDRRADVASVMRALKAGDWDSESQLLYGQLAIIKSALDSDLIRRVARRLIETLTIDVVDYGLVHRNRQSL